jgi:hypothetical protein
MRGALLMPSERVHLPGSQSVTVYVKDEQGKRLQICDLPISK